MRERQINLVGVRGRAAVMIAEKASSNIDIMLIWIAGHVSLIALPWRRLCDSEW